MKELTPEAEEWIADWLVSHPDSNFCDAVKEWRRRYEL